MLNLRCQIEKKENDVMFIRIQRKGSGSTGAVWTGNRKNTF